jgi:glycosyltransferase involved in cell wall biosynthesis
MARNLVVAMVEMGHEIVDEGSRADVSLVFIEPSGKPLAKKVVQRLDGIWFSPSDFLMKNRRIKLLYESCDHVIWQSEFDRMMTTRWWGQPRVGTVIHNGTPANSVKSFSIPEFEKLRNDHDVIFVSSANWHGQKRLRANVDFYYYAKDSLCAGKKCCMLIFGTNPDRLMADPTIFYAGLQSMNVCLEAYSMADWMIHLAWCDHSPNTVVQCLSQETPVICTEAGGTVELVDKFGITLKEPWDYDFRLYDYDSPPDIDVGQVERLPSKKELGHHRDVSMRTCAVRYVDVLERVIAGQI